MRKLLSSESSLQFHPARSAGLKRMHFDANNLVDSVRLTNFTILAALTFRFPNISSRQKAACRAGFRILLSANLSWFWEAEGPLTLARRYLPAACCHGNPRLSGGPMQQQRNIWYNPLH